MATSNDERLQAEMQQLRARVHDLEAQLSRRSAAELYLQALHNTALTLMHRHNLADLLETIVTYAGQLVNTPHGYLQLVEADGTRMTVQAATGVFRDYTHWVSRPGDSGANARVWRTGEPLIVEDYATWDERMATVPVDLFHAVAVLPLQASEKFIGVLSLAYTDPSLAFRGDDLQLLNGFAELAAIALDNAQLYQRLQTELAERKQTEDELRQREAKYRALFEQSNDAVFLMGLDGANLAVNQRAADMLGYNVDELLQIAYHAMVAPSERNSSREVLQALLSGEILPLYERVFRRKNGEEFPVEINVQLVRDDQGNPLHIQSIVRDISQRKQTEQQYRTLLSAEQRHVQELALLDQARTALALELDLSSLIRTVVESTANTFGYGQVSLYLLDGDTMRLQHQVGYDTVIAEFPAHQGVAGRVVRTGKPALIHDASQDPDFLFAMDTIKAEICVPLFDEGKAVGTLIVESTDEPKLNEADLRLLVALSEHINIALTRARVYAQMRESEARYRSVIGVLEEGIILLFADGTVGASNASAEQILGVSQRQIVGSLVGNNSWTTIHEDGSPFPIDTYPSVVTQRTGKPQTNVIMGIRKSDDSLVWISINSQPLFREGETQPYAVVASFTDITAQKYAEQALRDSEEKYRQFMEFCPVPVTVSDVDGAIIYANSAALRLFGATRPNQLIGHSAWEFYPPESTSFRDRRTEELRQGKNLGAEEYRLLTVDGQIIEVEGMGTSITFQGKSALLGVIIPLGERQRVQKQNLQLALERERVQVLANFVRDASHDFRTPLATIYTTLELLFRTPLSEQTQSRLRVIKGQAAHLEKLVNSLFILSRLDTLAELEFQPINLYYFLDYLIDKVRHLAQPKSLAVQYLVEPDLPVVMGDQAELERALWAVLENAIDYTLEGAIKVRVFPLHQGVMIEVRDTGIGISPDDLPRIFERFFRADRARSTLTGGLGLGLSIARKVVELHAGSITADSALGQGSTFRIFLPITPPPR